MDNIVTKVLEQLPLLPELLTRGVTIYGGILREIVRSAGPLDVESIDEVKVFDDIQHYLQQDGDVDMQLLTHTAQQWQTAQEIFDFLLEQGCHIEYMGHNYQTDNTLEPATDHMAVNSTGTYSIWLLKHNYRYELTLYDGSCSRLLKDCTVNDLRYSRQVVDLPILWQIHIHQRQLTCLSRHLKVLYRMKKMWLKGYRPRGEKMELILFQQLTNPILPNRTCYAYIQSLRAPSIEPQDCTKIWITRHPRTNITAELFYNDPVVKEMVTYLET